MALATAPLMQAANAMSTQGGPPSEPQSGPDSQIVATRPSSDPGALEGRTLGSSYRVLRHIDEGGMGVVAEAEHLRLHRHVAVKLLPARMSTNPQALARFRREAEILAQLDHVHVVQVLDYDVTDRGEPFLVMELLHGETLAKKLARDVIVSLDETVRIIAEIASGLTAAHVTGTVHRDLKPANIFLVDVPGERPFVKLLDFGVSRSAQGSSRLTMDHMLLGTPDYMAPEQAAGYGHTASPRTDEFSLAVIAFEMLAGRTPFMAEDLGELVDQIISAEAPRLSSIAAWVSDELDEVFARALSKEPEERYPTVQAFANALAEAAGRARRATSVLPTIRTRKDGDDDRPSTSPGIRHLVLALDSARQALALDELDVASGCAEEALRLEHELGDPVAHSILSVSTPLIEQVFARRLGGMHGRLEVCPEPHARAPLSPQLAFVLSRVEQGATVEDVVDGSGLRTADALRMLAHLASHGWVRVTR